MFRRYILPTLLIMIVSLGSAGAAARVLSETRFKAVCTFQAAIYVSRNPPQTPENQQFINALAAQQFATAIASGGIYGRVASSEGLTSAAVAGKMETSPAPGLGAFFVRGTDTDGPRAIRLANATCDEFVASIRSQREKEIAAQVEAVENRISTIHAELKRLEAIPPDQRTPTDVALIQSQRAALQANTVVIAGIISLPPDDIAVLSHAISATKETTVSLQRNLVVAGVGGLLACFLYILVLEAMTDRRRVDQPPATTASEVLGQTRPR